MGEAALATAERAVVGMIAGAFTGAAPAEESAAPEGEVVHLPFDADFQTKVVGLVMFDPDFLRKTAHLLRPEYLETETDAVLVDVALRHYQRFGATLDVRSWGQALREGIETHVIKRSIAASVIQRFKELAGLRLVEGPSLLGNAAYVESKIAEFCREQAVSRAVLESVDLIHSGKFDKIVQKVKTACDVGIHEGGEGYDYFAEAAARRDQRIDKASGKTPPTGITTGIHKMDEVLYHNGWGRRELASIMGGPKAGKTTALINFGKAASIAGHNVLYVTCEVAASVIADRLDACLSETIVKELAKFPNDVASKVEALQRRSGKFLIHEYASGTLKASMLRQLIERYRNKGVLFDLIIVDYADIMCPEHRTDNVIENSKSVYVDLRALAFEFNVAMLTATQTNREGHKAVVAKMDHVSEDFNKVRTVDLMISINKTEEEAARGECRLYFAASRNQEAGFTIVIKQNLAMMKFVEAVLRVE